jgi:hypothetical protein
VFIGNASAHSLALSLYNGAFAGALHTKNFFSAGTTDQQPKQVSAACMFGTAVSVPIPDVDHTQLFWVLGANPLASNGSLMTAPGIGRRLRAIQSAAAAWWCSTRAGRDRRLRRAWRSGPAAARLLLALANVLLAEGRVALDRLAPRGWSRRAGRRFGISAGGPRHVAGSGARDPPARARLRLTWAAVHGRISTCTQEPGVLATRWTC